MAPVQYTLLNTLSTPTAITSLSSNEILLAAGSVNGSIRIYALPETKVHKAIRGLPDEVASLVFELGNERQRYLWAAVGRQLIQFDTQTDNIILNASSCTKSLQISSSDDDDINQIDANKSHLAFSTDSGVVGVVDLSNYSISLMSKKHEQLCYTLSFIPGYSRELISGGFDNTLHHHHYLYKTLLSSHDITSTPLPQTTMEEVHISLAPPFIHCVTVSEKGVVAAGTADGRLILGFGATKRSGKQTKKKWEGLRKEDITVVKVADGPVVGLRWISETKLFLITLNGNLKTYDTDSKGQDSIELSPPNESTMTTGIIFKVNTTIIHGDNIIVGGLDATGKGTAYILSYSGSIWS